MAFNVGELQATLKIDDSQVPAGVDGVLGKLQEFASKGGAIAAAAGAAIGAGLSMAIAAAFEADTVTRKLEAQLGVTSEVAGKYGKAAGQLFANNYGESMGDTAEAIASVVKNMDGLGATSQDVLVGITGQVMSLAAVFDQDLNAVTRTAGTLMKTGMAKNATEALDIITAGFQGGIDVAGDLLDTFDEYSTVFRSIGLNGKDALGLLSQGLKGGARDADQVADSLKEMLLRIQDGSSKKAITDLGLNFNAAMTEVGKGGESAKATFDVILDKFREMPPGADKAALAIGLFGTKAEDAQKALGSLDIDTAAASFEAGGTRIAGAAAQLDRAVGGSLSGAFETLLRKLSSLASEGGAMLTPFLESAATGFGLLFDALQTALGFIGDIPGPLWAIGAAIAVWASWGAIAAGVTALGTALNFVASSAKRAWLALGPIGLLIGGITIAMAYMQDASDGVAEALDFDAQVADDLAGSLDKATGAVTAHTREAILSEAASAGVAQTLQAAGISLDLYADATLGNVDAQNQLKAAIRAAQDAVLGSDGAFRGLQSVLDGAHVSTEDLYNAIDSGDWNGVTQRVQEYANAQAAQSGNTQVATDIMNQFSGAMGAAANPVLQLGGASVLTEQQMAHLAEAQANAAIKTGDFGNSAEAAYAKILALATVGNLSGEKIEEMGRAAGLTAPQIDSIKAAAEGATKGASPLAEALASGSSAASEMDAAVQMLQLALDTLAGKSISAEQATRAQDAAIREAAKATREMNETASAQAAAQQKVNEMTAAGVTSGAEYEAAQQALTEATDAAADANDAQFEAMGRLAEGSKAATARAFEGAGGQGNYEAAVQAATAEMEAQRKKFIEQQPAADQASGAADRYADRLGLIPSNVRTAYDAIRAKEAAEAAQDVKNNVDRVPNSKTVTIDANGNASTVINGINVQLANMQTYKQIVVETRSVQSGNTVAYTGGSVKAMTRGAVGFAEGGKLAGIAPADPTMDNLYAFGPNNEDIRLRSNEWIISEPAVEYYGDRFMAAINNRRFPKPQGYAAGGSTGGGSPVTDAGSPVDVNVTVTLQGGDVLSADIAAKSQAAAVQELSKQIRARQGVRV